MGAGAPSRVDRLRPEALLAVRHDAPIGERDRRWEAPASLPRRFARSGYDAPRVPHEAGQPEGDRRTGLRRRARARGGRVLGNQRGLVPKVRWERKAS